MEEKVKKIIKNVYLCMCVGQARWKSDPWWYFLWGMEYKYRNSKRVDRTTRTGYWKLTGKERQIKDHQNQMIGYKRSLVFCRRGGGSTAARRGANTNWIMTEYHSTMTHNNPVCKFVFAEFFYSYIYYYYPFVCFFFLFFLG